MREAVMAKAYETITQGLQEAIALNESKPVEDQLHRSENLAKTVGTFPISRQ
jgi:hypothetical protein